MFNWRLPVALMLSVIHINVSSFLGILVSSKFMYKVLLCIKSRPSPCYAAVHGLPRSNPEISLSEHPLKRLPHRHRPIRHTKVRRNRPLTTNATSSGSLGSRQTRENTHIQDTGDLLDLPRKRIHLPNTVLTRTVLATGNVGLGQEGLEGSVDEEEILISLEGALLRVLVCADDGVDGAEFEEFVQNAVGSDGGDFDGDVFPVGEETGLEFTGVCGESESGMNLFLFLFFFWISGSECS